MANKPFMYVVQWDDQTFYGGCFVDVTKRSATYNKGKGAKRIHPLQWRPVYLLF